jgi:hypothetical protein
MTAMTDRPKIFSAPLGTSTRGLLELMDGSTNLTLHALAPAGYRDADLLATGSFAGRAPVVRIDGGLVRLAYQRSFRDLAFDWRGCRADVALAPSLPWDVIIRGGVSGLNADLDGIRLASFEIAGGVSDARLRLPRPVGTVRLFVLGGVNQLSVSRPADVPVHVAVHGGAHELAVDTLHLGAVGGRFEWETPGYADAPGRYLIEIHGGVSRARIHSGEPAAASGDTTVAPAVAAEAAAC